MFTHTGRFICHVASSSPWSDGSQAGPEFMIQGSGRTSTTSFSLRGKKKQHTFLKWFSVLHLMHEIVCSYSWLWNAICIHKILNGGSLRNDAVGTFSTWFFFFGFFLHQPCVHHTLNFKWKPVKLVYCDNVLHSLCRYMMFQCKVSFATFFFVCDVMKYL